MLRDPSGSLRAQDGGFYSWNRGHPKIDLYRDDIEDRRYEPDPHTRPEEDACFLAHEFGHFLSDLTGGRTAKALRALGKGGPMTDSEKLAILDEEQAGWRLGRETLARLGCTEWSTFNRIAEASINTYVDGLAARQSSAVTHPSNLTHRK